MSSRNPVSFDEMRAPDGSIRPAYQQLAFWLDNVPKDVLDYRRKEAEFIFRRIGITFAVYGESASTERLIPFDIIPRILESRRMDQAFARARTARESDQRLSERRLS